MIVSLSLMKPHAPPRAVWSSCASCVALSVSSLYSFLLLLLLSFHSGSTLPDHGLLGTSLSWMLPPHVLTDPDRHSLGSGGSLLSSVWLSPHIGTSVTFNAPSFLFLSFIVLRGPSSSRSPWSACSVFSWIHALYPYYVIICIRYFAKVHFSHLHWNGDFAAILPSLMLVWTSVCNAKITSTQLTWRIRRKVSSFEVYFLVMLPTFMNVGQQVPAWFIDFSIVMTLQLFKSHSLDQKEGWQI